MPTKYVGLFGLKGHGKTSVAKAICDNGRRGAKLSFIEKLRNIIHDVYGITELDQHRMKAANETPPGWSMTMRQAQQHLGTEGFRAICPSTWLDYLFKSYETFAAYESTPPLAVIDDVRFEDEVKAVKDRGGINIVVINPDIPIHDDNHESERYMKEVIIAIRDNRFSSHSASKLFDFVFFNKMKTINRLNWQVGAELLPVIYQHFDKV